MWNWDNEKEESCFAACATSEDFLAHIHAVNDDFLVACLDVGHAEMRPSGSGLVPMIQALKEIGYQGYLTLEADSHMKNYDVTTAQLGVQKLYEAAKRLKEMFEA